MSIHRQCDKDDDDPTSRCAPCEERNRPCGPRTLSLKRMESIRYNIQSNHTRDLVKWMMGQTSKHRDLLLKQLPAELAFRLSTAFNMHVLMQSSNTVDSERYFFVFISLFLTFY